MRNPNAGPRAGGKRPQGDNGFCVRETGVMG